MTILPPEPKTEADLMELAVSRLGERLPSTWTLARRLLDRDTAARVDGVLELAAPDETRIAFAIEIKRAIERRDVVPVVEQLRAYTSERGMTYPLLIARYLSPSVRAALADERTSYIDATGNMRVQLDAPALYISDRGEDRDPWRNRLGRPRGTLKGDPATRVVRAMVDAGELWTVRMLVSRTGVSTGATYRVLDYLQQEALVVRREDGRYELPSWRALIEAWSRDYGFLRSNSPSSFIAPRGLTDLVGRLAKTDESDLRYAVTGTLAASQWAEYAPARSAVIYADDVMEAAERWGLRSSTTAINVILAKPSSEAVYEGSRRSEQGAMIVSPPQAAVDLLSGPGRNPSEGEELLDWMERNESDWRR